MNLDKLSLQELRTLREDIDHAMALRNKRVRDEMRKRFVGMARDAGYSIDDVLGSTPASSRERHIEGRKPRKAAQSYVDKTTGVVWRGTGRMPARFNINRAKRL